MTLKWTRTSVSSVQRSTRSAGGSTGSSSRATESSQKDLVGGTLSRDGLTMRKLLFTLYNIR